MGGSLLTSRHCAAWLKIDHISRAKRDYINRVLTQKLIFKLDHMFGFGGLSQRVWLSKIS